jgi:hypothetical protein
MSALLEQQIFEIKKPFLIVCEGMSDARLICALLEHNSISNCNVGCPSDKGGHGSGIGAVAKYLDSVRGVMQVGRAPITGIALVIDSDLSCEDCFRTMCKYLEAARFEKPSCPFAVEDKGSFRYGIFLIPGKGKTGTLEHLLWEAAVDQDPTLDGCVETFCRCVGNYLDEATENQKAKMKLSATVGGRCKDNPWASASLIWSQVENPVPLGSHKFSELTTFLKEFTS